jgi:protein phosphatase
MTMSSDSIPINQSATENEQEITARFDRAELVQGWSQHEARKPEFIPRIRFAARTDLGRVRENNEDKFDFYEPDDDTLLAVRGSLYAVADGMGGHAAGQIASELALKNFINAYYNSSLPDVADALRESVEIANDTVYNIAAMIPSRSGMGTTLTACAVVQDKVYVVQIGDSRAYMIRQEAIRQVTQDHSWVAEQVRMGQLTEEEAELSPYRNVITRCIGTQKEVTSDVFLEMAVAGDTWILCSDGLSGHVHAEEILEIAGKHGPSEAARQLVELANQRGGKDNITVVIFSILGIDKVESSKAEGVPEIKEEKKKWSLSRKKKADA